MDDVRIIGKNESEYEYENSSCGTESQSLGRVSSLSSISSESSDESNLKKHSFPIRESDIKSNDQILKERIKKDLDLFIFDWDDTLLCTTKLSRFGYLDNNLDIKPLDMTKIQNLEKNVKSILEKAIEKGDTYIITNSESGWVEFTCKKYFPNVTHLLTKIKIISARDLYEKEYPAESKKWKKKAFRDLSKNYINVLDLPTNIICIGDSPYDLKAGKHLAKKFSNSFIKTIKFREYPSIEELVIQLKLVNDKFNFIYKKRKNLTITVEKKLKSK